MASGPGSGPKITPQQQRYCPQPLASIKRMGLALLCPKVAALMLSSLKGSQAWRTGSEPVPLIYTRTLLPLKIKP